MGNIIYQQALSALVAKNPAQLGAPYTDIDFQIPQYANASLTQFNNSISERYSIAQGSGSPAPVVLPVLPSTMGLLLINPDQDIYLTVTNANGTTPQILFHAGIWSVMNMDFTGLTAYTSLANALTGKYVALGV